MAESTMGTMIGYDFRSDGMYDKKHYLKDDDQVSAFIRTNVVNAFMQGREAMITDSGDNAVFHVKGGKVEWAGGADTQEFAKHLRALGVKQNDLGSKVREVLTSTRHPTLDRSEGLER